MTGKPSRTPAPRGNRRTLKHGAQATAKTLPGIPEARQAIEAALAESAPVRENGHLPPADRHMVELAAIELARVRRINDWLEERDLFDESGDVLPAVELATKATRVAADLLDKLGMSPTSRAKLGLDLARAADLATAMSEPDPARRRQMLHDAGVTEEADDER